MPLYATAKSNARFEVLENHTHDDNLPNVRRQAVVVEAGDAAEIAAVLEGEIHFRLHDNIYLLRSSETRFREVFDTPPDPDTQQTLMRRFEGE